MPRFNNGHPSLNAAARVFGVAVPPKVASSCLPCRRLCGSRSGRWFDDRGPVAAKSAAMPIETDSDVARGVRAEPMRLYNTVVHNCECHTFDDVTFGLMRIVGMGLRDAERKSREIDFFGSGVVATSPLEVAELYAQRLKTEVVSRFGTLLQTSITPA